ncbi:hypothetical protein [Acidithiobacillus ferrivorans]|uniref:hypothetical protein n=1 Tax=Acidithiobacillus ferrivorans TaxID=160808 RepID=UPI0011D2069F|nr:hypothetical protein [Acidithiobacillus ferrivorans]
MRKQSSHYFAVPNAVAGVGTLLEIFPSAALPDITLPTIRLNGTDADRLASDWSKISGDFSCAARNIREP